MLTLKCSACKRKLWKYDKIGKGAVLRCHKDRITRTYQMNKEGDKVKCQCGKVVGIDKGPSIKMISKSFVYSGEKRSG